MKDTKERILDAAERLFAEYGFDATSLRSITAEAGANLAAVNYHFKSKEALIQAIFARKLGLLNRQRFAMLETYQAEAGNNPVPLEKLVRAFIEPAFRLPSNSATSGTELGRLIGRMYSTHSTSLRDIIAEEFRGQFAKFIKAMQRVLPDFPAEETFWRLFFSIGTVTHTLAASKNLEYISDGLCKASEIDHVIERLISFIVAGLQAPLPHPLQEGGVQPHNDSKVNTRTNAKADRMKFPPAPRGH
jgi:AcrR family transcriptional regulator